MEKFFPPQGCKRENFFLVPVSRGDPLNLHVTTFLYNSCWWPSASEGPQKHDLTVFLEYNV
jgi:hypothetical protein